MSVVLCTWAKGKTTDKSLNSTWFICVNWARILNGSVFWRPVKFFIRLKIRPCERSLKLFCVFLRWHLTIPLCDCWIQKNYSRTLLTNDHLSTTVTLFCPGGQSIHWLLIKPLYNGNGHKSVSPTAKIISRQGQFFQRLMKKSRMVMTFDTYGVPIHKFKPLKGACSKHKMLTILIANVANLARSVALKFGSSFLCVFCLYYIIYDWITVMGYSKNELSTINMLYPS